jgi:copper chaperone CopZ
MTLTAITFQEHSMLTFDVQDMSCGHCVASITKAVQAADPQAKVEVDLARHRVQVQPAQADAAAVQQAIAAAGFTPTQVPG